MLAPMNDEPRWRELTRYVRYTEEDTARVAAARGVVEPHFERISDEFYERIHEHDDAHAVFVDDAQIDRLRASLVRWLGDLFCGRFDEAYYEMTLRIGRVHVRVGLPQRYMFTAMSVIRCELVRILSEATIPDLEATRMAVAKLLDLTLATMLESYGADFAARIEQRAIARADELSTALARAEAESVAALAHAPAVIVSLEPDGSIHEVNREACRVTGWDRDELIGRPFAQALFATDLQRSVLGEVTEAAAWREAEIPVQTKSGRSRSVAWRFARAGSDATTSRVLAVGRDVTDEKALTERTKKSERLAAIGTLAAGLAHEIRNPLNGAQLHVSFLERSIRKGGADPDMLEATEVVRDEIRRLGALVTEFLDFTRPKPLDLEPTSLGPLCERAAALVREDATRAGLELDVEVPRNDVLVPADGAKLTQVLLNLLRNAVDALTPTGHGSIKLRVKRRPRHATIDVEDDGPGLPDPQAPIFDAFYTTKSTGTGLGLSISHRIVEDHGGDITVDSRPGRTVFRVTLPLE
jgi:PAS domain S-box-containing protein